MRKNHNSLNDMILDKLLADSQLGTVTTQCAIGQEEACSTISRELADNIQNPTIIGITGGWRVITHPTRIIHQLIICSPVLLIERRISHDEVGLQILVLVVMEGIGSHFAQVTGYTTNSQVHLCQLIRGVSIFLTINRDITLITMMGLDKLHALNKHTARTTTGVVNLTAIRLNHLCYQVNDGLWRVVFTFTLSLGYSKLSKEVLIHTAHQVVLWVFQRINLIDLVEQGSQFGTVERQACIIVARQGTLQRWVAILNLCQSLINLDSDIVLLSIFYQEIPTTFGLQIKYVLSIIKNGIIGKLFLTFGHQLISTLRKAVVGILQEDKTQHHVLILRWFHRASQFIR